MNVTTDRISPDAAVLVLEGELDASNYRGLIETGADLYADGVRRLVLDLGGLTYMSSSGIVALHSLVVTFRGGTPPDPEAGWEAMHAVGRDVAEGAVADEVRLVDPQPPIVRVLDRTGLTTVLRAYPDRDAALA